MTSEKVLSCSISKVEEIFDKLHNLSSDATSWNIVKYVVNQIEMKISNDPLYYNKDKDVIRKRNCTDLKNNIDTLNQDIFKYIDMEYDSPFGILSILLDGEIPDILISNSNIKIQVTKSVFANIEIPMDISNQFMFMINHFINMQAYINETKCDIRNAIFDCTYGKFRFNIVHKSLSSFNSPMITIRKHITSTDTSQKVKSGIDIKGYEKSLGVNKDVLDKIKSFSNKSICIFGDTGSGKTTLLRYLISLGLEDKRNVCVIEDAAELFINTPISLITNDYFSIHDLFVAAMRQNPSHLIIGETRTEEIVDIMEAGLTFSIGTTIHATSFEKAIERIYFMSKPRGLPKEDIVSLVSSSIDMFIHIDNRKIRGVWERNSTYNHNSNPIDLYDEIWKI